MTAARRGDCRKAFRIARVALVIEERPGAIECGRPEIGRVPAHRVAGGVTNSTVDAFDARIRRHPRGSIGANLCDSLMTRSRRLERSFCPLPLFEERPHVGGEVLDHWKVFKRPDLQPPPLRNFRDMRAAGPARAPVHGHRARAAHSHAAGETIGERRVEVALHEGDHVQHGLVFPTRHAIDLIATGFAAPP